MTRLSLKGQILWFSRHTTIHCKSVLTLWIKNSQSNLSAKPPKLDTSNIPNYYMFRYIDSSILHKSKVGAWPSVCSMSPFFNVTFSCMHALHYNRVHGRRGLSKRLAMSVRVLKKRDLDSASSAPPPKRGRPKLDNPILQRYPPLQPSVDIVSSLQKQLEKETPEGRRSSIA